MIDLLYGNMDLNSARFCSIRKALRHGLYYDWSYSPHTVINQLGNPLGARGKRSPKLYQQRQFNIRSDNSATDGLL